jgi:hypothetical protein
MPDLFPLITDAHWRTRLAAARVRRAGQPERIKLAITAYQLNNMSKYTYTPDMGEISGFGGGYEDACRKMVIAGMEWFDANPQADPQFQGYKNIYGVINEENEDAKALSKAVLATCDDCTGAMHQASISHILAARRLGWEGYCAEMRKREEATP